MDVNDRAATKIVYRLIPVPDSMPEYKLIFALEPVQRNGARFSTRVLSEGNLHNGVLCLGNKCKRRIVSEMSANNTGIIQH